MTREVEALDYEAYPEMAERRIRAIVEQQVEQGGAIAGACVHRTGRVALGDWSILICVSAGHRPEAFAVARGIIDQIKRDVPIWKVELDGDERRRVSGSLPQVAERE